MWAIECSVWPALPLGTHHWVRVLCFSPCSFHMFNENCSYIRLAPTKHARDVTFLQVD